MNYERETYSNTVKYNQQFNDINIDLNNQNQFSEEINQSIFQVFEDKKIRQGFIRKVYSLICLQLFITFGFCLLTNLQTNTNQFMKSEMGQALYWISVVGLIMIMGTMLCCQDGLRKFPSNYIYLSIFTICLSYQLGMVTAFYNTQILIQAIGITGIITIILTIYACQTACDFTDKGGYLISFLLGIILIGSINIFVMNSVLENIYAGLGAIIFSCFIVYDTQLIIGGKHYKYSYSIDDYVFAAISIYLDIINLFIYILQLFSNKN